MSFKARYQKTADDGSVVTLYETSHAEWFVGRPGDDLAYHPTPMGAFGDAGAARRWAERVFPGGSWSRVPRGRARDVERVVEQAREGARPPEPARTESEAEVPT